MDFLIKAYFQICVIFLHHLVIKKKLDLVLHPKKVTTNFKENTIVEIVTVEITIVDIVGAIVTATVFHFQQMICANIAET